MPKTKKTEEVKLDTEHTTLIDGAFTVDRHRWGTWVSLDSKGNQLITSLTEEACIAATRFYLKGRQEGWDDANTVKHEGTVGGKL
jgi:hypothetical protein